MEKFTYKKMLSDLRRSGLVAILGGALLVSCGTQMGYTETDGVYYDPNTDTLPQGMVMNGGNRIGDYYDYQATDDQNKYLNSDNRNESWQNTDSSDWGKYNGTETYYTDSWGYYGSPYYYSPGFSMSFGWGFGGFYDPWGYSPFYGYYSPYYSSFYGYYPYYGYNPYFGYNPYYSYYPHAYYPYIYSGYNTYNGGFTYKRSGSDGSFNNMRNSGNGMRNGNTNSSGFRTQSNTGFRNGSDGNFRNQGVRPGSSAPNNIRYNSGNAPRMRTNSQPNYNTPRQTPSYQQPTRSYNDGGGFRSGNSGGGGFNSGSSGNTGGSRSSGGFRR